VRVFATLRCDPALLEGGSPQRDSAAQPALERGVFAAMLQPYAHTDILLDERATLPAVRTSKAATITQFVAHGVRGDGTPSTAGIALAPSALDTGFLGHDLLSQWHSSPLVIVSACGAGRTQRRAGEDDVVSTLGHAFFAGGAHTVIQSMADLRLQSHLRLLQVLHQALAEGAATAAALRDARRTLAATEDLATRLQHATLQVSGLGHLPVIEAAGK
jgi:hypothetical protein